MPIDLSHSCQEILVTSVEATKYGYFTNYRPMAYSDKIPVNQCIKYIRSMILCDMFQQWCGTFQQVLLHQRLFK